MNRRVVLSAILSNVGSKLRFLDQGDWLPLAFRLGGAWRPSRAITFSAETVCRKSGLASFHMGVEWMPAWMIGMRAGYQTDSLKGLSPLAGLTLGVHLWEHELSYAWVPLGELGDTNYVSLLTRFGNPQHYWNFVHLPSSYRSVEETDFGWLELDNEQTINLIL